MRSCAGPRAVVAVIGLLLGAITGCGAEGGTGRDATTTLAQQRTEVRGAARDLLVESRARLSGRVLHGVGGWRGCEPAFPEEFRSFHYLVQARLDLTGVTTRTALRTLRDVLVDAGFTVAGLEEGPGRRRSLDGVRDTLRATFSHPAAGAFVLVSVSGPCVDVPKSERDRWLRMDEPHPRVH